MEKLFLAEVAYLHGKLHYRLVSAKDEQEVEEKVDREYLGGVTTLNISSIIE